MIDAYSHFWPEGFSDTLRQTNYGPLMETAEFADHLIERTRDYTNVDSRVTKLNRYEFDLQVATPDIQRLEISYPNPAITEKFDVFEIERILNEGMSEASRLSGGKIVCSAGNPLKLFDRDEERALEEMRFAIKDLKLKGFEIPSNQSGRSIERYQSFWKQAESLGAIVWIHPVNPVSFVGRPYENEYDLTHVFGWPFETTLAVSRLVQSSIIRKYPQLKIISHHMGGMIPFFAGRISESYGNDFENSSSTSDSSSLMDFYKVFYYDTAVGGSPAAIKCGYEVFGEEKLVLSTDYPFGSNGGDKRLATYPKLVEGLEIPNTAKDKILDQNMRRLLEN